MSDDLERLKRRAARERQARKEAERLLEERSRALWEANQALKAARDELEQRVQLRTRDLQEAVAAAEEANAAKTRFLAHTSHELRTPLTSILGYTEELRTRFPAERDLETVERNASHLLDLINEVLELARVESGKLVIETAPADLRALLDDVVQLARPRAEAKGLRFRHSVDDTVAAFVRLDALKVRQILINLVGNAVKFTESGAVAIRVFCPDADLPDRIRIDVLDTGRGVPESLQASIFEPFDRGNLDTPIIGTGLGLPIAKRLVEAMGGTLTLKSAPGRGSTFSLTLDAPSDTASSVASPVEPPSSTASLDGVTLLLAEDAPDSRVLLGRWCRAAGATVILAENGALAVERTHPGVDLVLMDMQMPIMDGYTATRTLRDQGFGAPILALTALSMPGDRKRCEDAGCDGYISKPVRREDLLAGIRAHLTAT